MTALFMESFDQYGTGGQGRANMIDGVWADIVAGPGTPPTGARTGSYALFGTGGNGQNRIVLPASESNVFMSLGVYQDGLPTINLNNSICTFNDSSNAVIVRVIVQSTGVIAVVNGSNSVLGQTQGPVIKSRTWHFVEMNFNQSSGSFTLRVDDASASLSPAINITGLTLSQTAQITTGTLASIDSNMWIDDLFIRNASGTINNSWLGDRRIALLTTSADTTTAGWSPSFYNKFGPGVLQLANMVSYSTSPQNQNAAIAAPAATSLDVGNSDFTLETFIRFEALPAATQYSTIFSRWDAGANQRSYRLCLGGSSFNNSSLQFDFSTDGTNSTVQTPIVYPFTPTLNFWHHIALVRASNELLLFVDGQQLGLPIPITATLFGGGTEPFGIGAEAALGGLVSNTYVIGMYDETRFTNGYARYTAPFAVPAAAFPRGSGDAHWSSVVFLAGYDTAIQDESSFARSVSAYNGATQFTTNDGPSVGTFSTISKTVPDDNTFISASLVNATGTLTMTSQPASGDTVTVGTKDGTTAAVYAFSTSVTSAYSVLIDTTAENTLLNLYNAINAGPGSGTKYGAGTSANYNVIAIQLPAGQIEVRAITAGTAGNSIATTATGTAATWSGSTLSGGSNIPGPSAFKVQRPPPTTTIVSAVQLTARANKTDAGVCTLQNALVGALGGVTSGTVHSLATNPNYYLDIIETDPDNSNPITPSTIINGSIRVNRTS